jgi:site-specific recombinase XerD
MDFSFILDRPASTSETYILVLAPLSDGRLKYSIKEKILPELWDKRFQRPLRVKDRKLHDTLSALHKKLDRFSDRLEELRNEAKRTGTPLLRQHVSQELDKLLHKKVSINTNDFFVAAELIKADMVSGKLLTPAGKLYSKGTLKNYGQSIGFLKEFSRHYSLNFSNVTLDTYRNFMLFLNKQDYSLNYIGQHVKNWKRIANEAGDRGWHANPVFKHKDFNTPSEETFDIYLTEAELKTMAEKKLVNKTMEICRDWFIVDCYTGLRISDLKLLTPENLDNQRIIIANEKTDARVVLPVHPLVEGILKKWVGFPPRVSDQEINREIKKVGALCRINQKVLYQVTQGGVRVDYHFKKYEMISNHTARRSFITNLLRMGTQETIIMKLTGIKKAATLARYNKMSEHEVADVAAALPFFKR